MNIYIYIYIYIYRSHKQFVSIPNNGFHGFPLKVIFLVSNALSHLSQSYFYALLDEWYWDASQFDLLHIDLWQRRQSRICSVAVEYTDCFFTNGWESALNVCHGYDTKQSDDGGPVMLELWGMRSTPLLPLLPGPLWPGVVAPDRVLSMGQIELNCVLMLNWIVWNKTVFDISAA